MLVVIALLATLMAIGAGAWLLSRHRYEAERAAAEVEVNIRQARNNAIFAGTPAFVEFQTNPPPGGRQGLIPWGYQLVAMYHFEESGKQTPGGRDASAFMNNCVSVEGRIGRGVATAHLRGRQGVKGYVECLPGPDYDCEDGGFLEAYIYIEYDSGMQQYVFHKPDAYALYVNNKGYLSARVGMATAEATSFLLPMRRWTKVGMAWDHLSIRLLVEDAIVAVEESDKTPINDQPLFIGDPDAPVLGRIDEARVLAAVRGSPFKLPPGAKLVHNAAPWSAAFFAPDGTLDLRYHPGALRVEMHLDGKRHTTIVSRLGQTRRLDVERIKTQQELDDELAEQNPSPPPVTILPPREMVPFKLPPLPGAKPPKDGKSKPGGSVVETIPLKPPGKKPEGGKTPATPVKEPAGKDAGGGAI